MLVGQDNALTMKTLGDAILLRNSIIDALETADNEPNEVERKSLLTVVVTQPYQGRRRMTLTYRIIKRARRILWIVTGSEKVEMLARLRNGDVAIHAGRVRRDYAAVLADRAATGM